MAEPGFPSQCESLLLANRWAKAVDFGSPLTAWSPEMLKAYREANGDVHRARQLLQGS